MPSVIHDNQNAFVEKRLITDNVIVAFEAFHSVQHRKLNGSNHFALKLDLSKAFDKVEWNFFGICYECHEFLFMFGFSYHEMYFLYSFSILITDVPSARFSPTWGICHGDLFSPYLFIIY